jgi:protein-tyrosine phosphatase
MLDLHTHVLPGIDDGARDWTMAVDMCRMAFDDGSRHLVCAPHANDAYPFDRERFQGLVDELKRAEGVPNELELTLGCDLNFSYQNIQAALASPARFAIGTTRYLLTELSDYAIPPAIGEALSNFIERGMTPVITHPERNLVVQQRPELAISFAEKGCVIQVTANSLTGFWGKAAKSLALWLLEHQAVHLIASDAHNTSSRPPILSKAREMVASHFGESLAHAMVQDNPDAILKGKPLPYFPKPIGV